MSRYCILQVNGFDITPSATVVNSHPGAMLTVCDMDDACRELAHFRALQSKTLEVRDANIAAARYEAELFIHGLNRRNRAEVTT